MAGILAAFVTGRRTILRRIRLITSIVIPSLFQAAGRRSLEEASNVRCYRTRTLVRGQAPVNPQGRRGDGIGDATEDGDDDNQADS